MIHLDTNLLIAASRPGDAHAAVVGKILRSGAEFAVSSVVWMQFLSRPVEAVRRLALRKILAGGIVPFDEAAAVLAGELFQSSGSKRSTRMDTMIAAAALLSDAELATMNPEDFLPFQAFGLRIYPLTESHNS